MEDNIVRESRMLIAECEATIAESREQRSRFLETVAIIVGLTRQRISESRQLMQDVDTRIKQV